MKSAFWAAGPPIRTGALGLHPRDYAVMASLAAHGSASQHAVCDRLRIDPSTMVAVVDHLEQAGLVERRRDPDDRRRYALLLTPEGEKLLARGHRATRRHTETILAPLDAAERERLHELLVRLTSAGHIPPGLPSLS